MKNLNRIFLCLLLGAVLLLSGCGKEENTAPTVPKWPWEQKKVESLTLVVTAEDFENLEKCENLRYLDITGSTCYEEIMAYTANHPDVEIRYAVPVGSTTVKNTETEITLNPEDGTYAILDQYLPYLPQLQEIYLTNTGLTDAELEALRKDFPSRNFRYSLNISSYLSLLF